MRSIRRSTIGSALVVALLAVLPLTATQTPARIVAIGDIHGSYSGLTAILRRTGLVNDQLRWSGGNTTLVQTGDYTDRGTDVRKVMDLIMNLEKEAKSAGGQVVALAGNHEIMNLIGDFRDVTPEICATFATPKSASRLDEAWTQYERLARARGNVLTPLPPVYAQSRDAWFEAHPPGCLEYREAMGPDGAYGRWLRPKDIAAVVGDTLFMHAGLNPSRPAPQSVAEINDRARAEVRRFDVYRKRLTDRRLALPFFDFQDVLEVSVIELQTASAALAAAKAAGTEPPSFDVPLLREAQEMTMIAKWSLIEPEGPLWFRGYAQWPEDTTLAQVHGLLDALKVQRIVVGHTPTGDRRVVARYGNRVFVIDTGMLAEYYKGQPAALEIAGARVKAIYLDDEVDLTPSAKPAGAVAATSGVRDGLGRADRPARSASSDLSLIRPAREIRQ